ncbi:phosphate transport system regulatory protein PhoU [Desulfuribacillus stibiiarsenatis]|uniref:Phosphate-specific transport system accessory protein PhoU n=1 Tax=Desulfuribacillus stibiiarsenatis TaxID=1390249 RepID=A0A1E5L2Z2_9FIRM|nr:phosphate signaling complex protein PhoU [Desulfuribacillus stibiiarsenatis]OEH84454.1 phosphate transport system regulatory protein PhoU [Desulfuribacillus stibiiarsenatis]
MGLQRKSFDAGLTALNERLLNMGTAVEEALDKALQAFVDHNNDLAKEVIDQDGAINDTEDTIDELVIQLIAHQQPVAKDLRRIVTALKMNANLERMGDLACNIAKTSIRMKLEPELEVIQQIQEIAAIVKTMIHDIIQAYINEDVDAAKAIALKDDTVDRLYKEFLNNLFAHIRQNPDEVETLTQLAFLGRHFERLGDYVTNIAEYVVYMVDAKRSDLN